MQLTLITAATALAALTAATWAETQKVDRTGHGQASSKVMPVGENLVVVHASTMYQGFEGGDPNNSLASATGPYLGSVLIEKGAVSGEGHCQYSDFDGDMIVMKWIATGATADSRTFSDGTDDMGKSTNMVTGEVTLN